MKKLILCSILNLFIIKVYAQTTVKMVSLNGIERNVADTMISNYEKYISTPGISIYPKQQSIWFDIATFKAMVAQLDKDRSNATDVNHATDGIRIYFGLKGNPGDGDLRTIIKATYRGVPDTGPTKYVHMPYFYNKSDNAIFSSKNIQGRIFLKGVIRRGEQLYKRCKNCTSNLKCDEQEPHYVHRDSAENWVANFGKRPMITNSEWFDLNMLDNIAKQDSIDGVRIYFAKHDPHGIDKYQNSKDKDAFIFEFTNQKGIWPLYSHRDYFDCIKWKTYFDKFTDSMKLNTGNTGGSNPGGQDNGELCPDNCKP